MLEAVLERMHEHVHAAERPLQHRVAAALEGQQVVDHLLVPRLVLHQLRAALYVYTLGRCVNAGVHAYTTYTHVCTLARTNLADVGVEGRLELLGAALLAHAEARHQLQVLHPVV